MKQLERDLDLISVILSDADVLAFRIKRFGMNVQKFVNDRSDEGELAYDAIMSPVYRISEDAAPLSNAVTDRFPDYPWKQIRGFRNFVAHGYREVDRRIAWDVASIDIPNLAKLLREYLNENAPLLSGEDTDSRE